MAFEKLAGQDGYDERQQSNQEKSYSQECERWYYLEDNRHSVPRVLAASGGPTCSLYTSVTREKRPDHRKRVEWALPTRSAP